MKAVFSGPFADRRQIYVDLMSTLQPTRQDKVLLKTRDIKSLAGVTPLRHARITRMNSFYVEPAAGNGIPKQ